MKIKTTLLSFLIPFAALSQSTWRNGTVVTTGGATLTGQINDIEWHTPPTKIEFRKADGTITEYAVDDIISFSLDRPARYEAHEIEYDGDTQSLKNLPYGKETLTPVRDKVFLEVIVNAPIGLLRMQARSGRQHYFLKMDGTVIELLNRSYQHPTNNAEIATFKKYIQQLTLITNGCPEVQKALTGLSYTRNNLEKIITRINACRNTSVSPIWEGKIAGRKSANAGIAIQGFLTNSFILDFFNAPASNVSYGVAAFIEFYSRKKPNQVSFYNELIYKVITPQPGKLYTGDTDLSLECNRFKLINAIRISKAHKRGGRFYGGLGFNNGIRFNTLLDDKILNMEYRDLSTGIEIGFIAMIGETFKIGKTFKINTELRYDYEFQSREFYGSSNIGLSLQFNLK